MREGLSHCRRGLRMYAAPMSDKSEAEVIPQDDNREFAAAGLANDAIEAALLVTACEEAGIDAFVDAARDGMVEKVSAPSEKFEIKVPIKDVDAARQLISERRAALESDPEGWQKAAEAESEKSKPEP